MAISASRVLSYNYNLATTVSAGERAQLCLNNSGKCDVLCSFKIQQNTCNPETLQWKCICSNGKAPLTESKFQFPIESQQCNGEQLECVEVCLKNLEGDRNTCSAKCKNELLCGGPNAKQTKTFVEEDEEVVKTKVTSDSSVFQMYGVFALAAMFVVQ